MESKRTEVLNLIHVQVYKVKTGDSAERAQMPIPVNTKVNKTRCSQT